MAVLAGIKRVLKPWDIWGRGSGLGIQHSLGPLGNLNPTPTMISEMFSGNGGHPQIAKEVRARFYEAEFVDV